MRCAVLLLGLAACGRLGFDVQDSSRNGDGGSPTGDGGIPVDNDAALATYNVAFITSTTQTAGSLGIAGADAVCQARATAGGLSGTYIAWLSTTTTPARDRLLGARGWIRRDGVYFVDTIADLVASKLLSGLVVDESGNTVIADTYPETGTGPNGDAVATCMNWSTTTAMSTRGWAQAAFMIWTDTFATGCTVAAPLLCFGIDHNVALAPLTPQRRAFVTAGVVSSGGGRAAADALCTSEASAASLPGSYLALMASSSTSPASRFVTGAAWSRVDGTVVLTDMTSLLAPITRDAAGNFLQNVSIWTGAATLLTAGTNASTCTNWTSTDPANSAVYGSTGYEGIRSINNGNAVCGFANTHVYCLEQ